MIMRTDYWEYINPEQEIKKAYLIPDWPEKKKIAVSHKNSANSCIECDKIIPLKERYVLYQGLLAVVKNVLSGVFAVQFLYEENKEPTAYFELCLKCNQGWTKVIEILRKKQEFRAIIVFGLLREAIQFLFDEGYITNLEVHRNGWVDICPEAETLTEEDKTLVEKEKSLSQMQIHSSPLL
ncbi:MAG: hypothetical protein ABH889_02430 [Candidatus Portnoybacteria bacterium]